MRITSPVCSLPDITYITGMSIINTDDDNLDHSIVISVADPHSLESSCPVGMSQCLANGALRVDVNGEEIILAPGQITVAPGIAIAAVNLPGACRSFGFEKYWEWKKLELLTQSSRTLRAMNMLQDMSDWILADPTATNMVECTEYVARATVVDDGGFVPNNDPGSQDSLEPWQAAPTPHAGPHRPVRPTGPSDLANERGHRPTRPETRRHGSLRRDARAYSPRQRRPHHAGHGRHSRDAGRL